MTGGRGAAAAAGRGGGPAPGALAFTDDAQSISFGAAGFLYRCSLTDYQCTKGAAIPAPAAGAAGRGAAPEDDVFAAPEVADDNTQDGMEFL